MILNLQIVGFWISRVKSVQWL